MVAAMPIFSRFIFPIPAKEQFYSIGLGETKWNEDPPAYPYTWGQVTSIMPGLHRLILAPHTTPCNGQGVTPDVAEELRVHAKLSVDRAFYDVTTIFCQIFTMHAEQPQIDFVHEIEIVLWLLNEQDCRHFYKELHAYTNPADSSQDLSCELSAVTILTCRQAVHKTFFRDGEYMHIA